MSEFPCKDCRIFSKCETVQCSLLWEAPTSKIDEYISKNICPDCGSELVKIFYEKDNIKNFFFHHYCGHCGHSFDCGSRRHRKFDKVVPVRCPDLIKEHLKGRGKDNLYDIKMW